MQHSAYDVHQATLNAIRFGQAVIPAPIDTYTTGGGGNGGKYDAMVD